MDAFSSVGLLAVALIAVAVSVYVLKPESK